MKKDNLFKEKIIRSFNDIFENNPFIEKLSGNEDISIMLWRASQPFGIAPPISLQFFKAYNVGFCGDWFEYEGFGRIEGAIISSLELAKNFNLQN